MPTPDEIRTALGRGGKITPQSAADIKAALAAKPAPSTVEPYESTGDLEADTAHELAETKKALNASGGGLSGAAKQWAEKFARMNDSEFWVALCFRDRDTKEEFLRHFDLYGCGGDKYLNGHEVSNRLGHDLPDPKA